MPHWVVEGYHEYAKRLPLPCSLHLVEIPLGKRSKPSDLARLQRHEGELMLSAVVPQAHIVALDERGQAWNTSQLATQLAHWQREYDTVALLVGGPEGLAVECLQRAHQKWSLSSLTLPHPLVRILVAEQLYRAWSVLNHHPYHRA